MCRSSRINLLLMIFLSICTSVHAIADSSLRPAWISGSSDVYPSGQYLVGVGESASQERAKDKARADLVKVIQVKIDATTNLKERVASHETSDGITEDVYRSSLDEISASSQVEMKNIEIIDTWFDEENDSYFALAVLARAKASSDLSIEMKELDNETSRHIKRADESSDMFDRIAQINKAVIAQQRRRNLGKYLVAIDSSSTELKSNRYDVDSLESKIQKIQRQIPISINVIGNNKRVLTLYTKGGLSSIGYAPKASEKTKYVIDVQLDKEPVVNKDELYWLFANLEIKLRDTVNNKVIGACSWELKEASQYKNRVEKKLLLAVNDMFASEFHTAFNAFINAKPCESLDD